MDTPDLDKVHVDTEAFWVWLWPLVSTDDALECRRKVETLILEQRAQEAERPAAAAHLYPIRLIGAHQDRAADLRRQAGVK